MSTLRVSNIEAKADASSPTIDEKVKITSSDGRVLVQVDGKTAGITSIGINTTSTSFTIDANQNVQFVGVITAANVNTTGVSTFTSLNVGTGTSISSPSSNTLTLGTNNTEAVRISSTGSVGINTNNPGRALHIQGNGSVEQIWEQGDGKANTKKYNLVVDSGSASVTPNIYLRYLNDSYVGGNYVWAYNGASQIHQIYSNGNQIATVNGSGVNVTGIVTASTAINAPGSVVQTIWKNLGSASFSATSTSSSYRATGYTNTITPKFSTSRIFHIVTIGCQFVCDGQIVIYRNGSQSSGSLMDSYRDGITASYINDMPAYTFTYLDTTPSSSTLNYELYCRATGCSGVMFVGSSGDFDASWTIMEIAN